MLETGMLGVFVARDIILFYVFFEFTLIPLFFLIGIWGSEERRYAAVKFFLFTLAGSVLTFLGLLAIVLWNYYHPSQAGGVMTFSIPELTAALAASSDGPRPCNCGSSWRCSPALPSRCRCFRCTPGCRWPTSRRPTAGSVILAGVLLKIGTYGFARFNLPMLPEATATLHALAAVALAGRHHLRGAGGPGPKRHQAADRLFQRQPPGLLHVGPVRAQPAERAGRRAANGQPRPVDRRAVRRGGHDLRALPHPARSPISAAWPGGLPVLAFFMSCCTLSSIGLPGLNGFAGEFLMLLGMFQRGWADAPPALVSTIA